MYISKKYIDFLKVFIEMKRIVAKFSFWIHYLVEFYFPIINSRLYLEDKNPNKSNTVNLSPVFLSATDTSIKNVSNRSLRMYLNTYEWIMVTVYHDVEINS